MRTLRNRTKQKNFVSWCKTVEASADLPLKERMAFTESWPIVANSNDLIRGAFVAHWSLILGGEINHIALPVTIGTLTFMQYAADQHGLTDLSNTINTMIANIPRIHNKILSDGEENEEE